VHINQLDQGVSLVFSCDYKVYEALFQLKLGFLEAFGELWRIGSFDDAGARKYDEAPGSAMVISPSIAKLAVTPPVVGSQKTIKREPFPVEFGS
jgi:hypothetical protein